MNYEPTLRSQSDPLSSSSNSTNVTYVLNFVNNSTKVLKQSEGSLKQNLCFICQHKFKESILNLNKTRKKCGFCKKDVCSKCSELKMNLIKEQKKIRICICCLNDSIFKYFKSLILAETIRKTSEDWNEPQNEDLIQISRLKERVYMKKQEIERIREEIEEIQKKLRSDEQFNEHILGKDIEIVRNDYMKLNEENGQLGKKEEINLEVLKKLKEEAGFKENLVNSLDKEKKKVKNFKEVDSKQVNLLNDQIYFLSNLKKICSHDVSVLTREVANIDNNTCSVF